MEDRGVFTFKAWVRLAATALVIATFSIFPAAASANTIAIKASAVPGAQLLEPGQILTIPVMLEGTKRFDYMVRAHIIRDGIFIDVTLNRGTLDDYDKPVYQVTIPAPLHELKYRFFLYGDDNTILASTDELVSRRSCVPQLSDRGLAPSLQEETQTTAGDVGEGIAQAEKLALQSRVLERHIFAYESALKLLEEIDGVLKAQSAGGKS